MPFAAAMSTNADTVAALDEVSDRLRGQIAGDPDLAFLFFTPHHSDDAEHLAATTAQRFGVRYLLGCTGESIVGNEREVEWKPALCLWLGKFSADVQLEPIYLLPEKTPDGYSIMGLPDSLHEADPAQSVVLLLADPFSFPADLFLHQLNESFPGLRVMGGMASGGRGPGECRLIVGEKVREQGAVGVLMQGPINVRSIVSQGCRPIGRHYLITKARDNVILELGGKPPLVQLQQLWQELPPAEQQLFQQGLHVGRVINEYQGEFQRGDFLVRNVVGLDSESGALAITERVRVGQTVQFHVRDAASADEDLHALLQMDVSAHSGKPAGALLFTCNGRGTRLFSQPDHDAGTVRSEAGEIPLAGFFAQGELGPIGGQNFIHGFTASVVLFEDDQ
jgi:small ligand-binding sensory domain FIST